MNLSAIASFSSSSWKVYGGPLANHLWQSTVFGGVVWLLTLLLRRNRAQARYCLWLVASAKFLLPFSLLVGLGSRIAWSRTPAITKPELFFCDADGEFTILRWTAIPLLRSAASLF